MQKFGWIFVTFMPKLLNGLKHPNFRIYGMSEFVKLVNNEDFGRNLLYLEYNSSV